jgi:hypothetical protein
MGIRVNNENNADMAGDAAQSGKPARNGAALPLGNYP